MLALIDLHSEPYVPTIDLDNAILTGISMGYIKLRRGQWVIKDGEKCRYLYTRKGGVNAFSKPIKGENAVAWAKRMNRALAVYDYEVAYAAALVEDAQRQEFLDNHRASMGVFARIGYALKG